MAPVAKTPTFDSLIEDFRQSAKDAANQKDWQTALYSTCSSLLWRSVRLAIKLGVVPASFEPAVSWKLTALRLRPICDLALAHGEEDVDYRIKVVIDVLAALMDVTAALETGQYKTGDGALQLTISSANLGRCEILLGFAEEGFWEQVYEWRIRQGGKPKGTLAKWKEAAAPTVQGWIDADPNITVKVTIDKLYEWLKETKNARDWQTAKSAIRQMRTAGLITFPERVKKLTRT